VTIPEPGPFAMRLQQYLSSPRRRGSILSRRRRQAGKWLPASAGMTLLGLSILIFLICATPCQAQSGDDAALYRVTDVPVDITSDSSAHARDQAIAEAQRSALEQLITRLNADSSLAAKLDDDGVSALVQNFEVQNEHTSSVRYIGTFTVQFRPNSIRDWLGKSGSSYTETRSKPIIVLPILISNGHPLLWEEHTRWWAAWENASNTNLVPIILPTGGLDDIAVVSTEEAVDGNPRAIKALVDKYQAGGAIIADLEGDLDNPGSNFKLIVTRYDAEGTAASPLNFTLPPASDKSAIDNALSAAVKQARSSLESAWRETVAASTKAPPMRLPVVVPIDTLDEWTRIKRKLGNVKAIERTDVITLARGTTNIEIEFRGGVEQLQDDLAQQNLTLTQDGTGGAWVLRMNASQL